MASKQMQNQVASMRESLFKQGFLDEQFIQLEDLEDASNPNFVEEVCTVFFRDSLRQMTNIEQALQISPFDFTRLDDHMHHFKGSSSSIGAAKVKYQATLFREYCRDENAEGVRRAFEQMKKDLATLKKKVETYFQLIRQVGPTHTAGRPK
ncbi:Signal transduction histidine kinase [Macleaya cordata]|uniref:Histidine-containing phosphotransfer protein n=1 Tax=Macleaya cordata TaxID=56857 RepID=A0A200QDK5_MACCD|nr:Signal transduction histidine kinase [Macleaya cordata]